MKKENILSMEEKKDGKGKGGKYLEKEKIWCAKEKKNREEGEKYLEKENILSLEEKNNGQEKGRNN